jgi:hypothetical protein
MRTENKVIIYKGIEIIVVKEGDKNSGIYIFYYNGEKHTNNSLDFAKRMITRTLKDFNQI